MIDRVAAAIFDEFDQESDYGDGESGWRYTAEDVRDEWRAIARAAIAAMREPTAEMVEAADQAMIDTALAEDDA